VKALIAQLKHRDPKQRGSAANRIGQMGEAAKEAIPTLLAILAHEEDKPVIGQVSFALSQMGDEAVPGLTELLKIPRLRTKVEKSLRKIGTPQALAVLSSSTN
jgi:HEAT repeat protein